MSAFYRYITLSLSLLLPFPLQAKIAADTIWYDNAWKEAAKEHAAYYRTYRQNKTGSYRATDHYLNGRVQMTGDYQSLNPEIKHGTFVYYDSLGNITAEEHYVASKLSGVRKAYYPGSRDLFSKVSFKADELNGPATYYFKDGRIRGKASYSMGRMEGENTWYFTNGRIANHVHFKPEDSTALLTQYDTDGNVQYNVQLDRQNRFQGLRTSYYPQSEQVRARWHFVNDTPHGELRYYDFTCGTVSQRGNYVKGKKEGLWSFFNKCDTTLHATFTFRNGIKDGPVLIYDETGRSITRQGQDSAGFESGAWRYYFPGTRQLSMVRHYKGGVLNGELTTYFPNGQLRRREIFQDGTKMEWNCYSSTGADTVYYDRYTAPAYPDNFRELLARQVEYPEQARAAQLHGNVYVSIYIDAKGSIYYADVVKTSNEVFNEEALRVAMLLPIYAPAMDDGQPIETTLILPVSFSPDDARAPYADF